MDVSDLRKRILRAVDDARKDAAARRVLVDESTKAYGEFLGGVAVPMLRQAATVLSAAGAGFAVETPAGTARLASQSAAETYLEVALDTSGSEPEVVGRISLARGRQGLVVEERVIAPGKPVAKITEEDFASYLVSAAPRLIVRS